MESAWGHIPLSLKAVIPLCDVAAVEAVGGKNTASAPLTLHLKFQPFHDDPSPLNSSTNNKKKGMFSRLFSSSDQSNTAANKPDAMRRSTGTAETLGSKSVNNMNNNSNSNNANPSLPPTVPKRTQSMRLSSSNLNHNQANTANVPTDPITVQRSLSASSQQQWEVGSTHSFASSDSENNHQSTSKKSKRELQAMGYYGKVVKEMYLRTDTPEVRIPSDCISTAIYFVIISFICFTYVETVDAFVVGHNLIQSSAICAGSGMGGDATRERRTRATATRMKPPFGEQCWGRRSNGTYAISGELFSIFMS